MEKTDKIREFEELQPIFVQFTGTKLINAEGERCKPGESIYKRDEESIEMVGFVVENNRELEELVISAEYLEGGETTGAYIAEISYDSITSAYGLVEEKRAS